MPFFYAKGTCKTAQAEPKISGYKNLNHEKLLIKLFKSERYVLLKLNGFKFLN